ncbi:maleylpyruvate isomerase N-terminal domain-containing protein [Nocardia sp. BMG51109]|uniref:maleylpyruvate isomerase N-terminal domain-containing protein n=1 Tax=Nocardia sp. BMG51109 TaxID=1056816 RepID=UPI000465D260|nr:maleylpyruvate isomerase N-terminal domain-containing protein [Nocardia sp. BMG51109]
MDVDIEALEPVNRAWGERVAALTPEQWATPTRLPGWTVQDLVAHMAPDAQVLDFLRGEQVESPAVTTAPHWLRTMNEPGGPAHTMADDLAEMAQQAAAVGRETLVGYFADHGPTMLAEFRAAEPAAGLRHPLLGSVSFRAIADTMTVEGTVHLLDLIAAIGGEPVPEAALRRTVEILSAVPDSVTFIEAATGRSKAPVLPVMR